MKATEQYFSVALYITLHKVVLTFESGINPYFQMKSIEYCFVPMGLLIMLYDMVLTLGAGYSETFQLKATEEYFPLIMFILVASEWVLPNEATEHFWNKLPNLYFV